MKKNNPLALAGGSFNGLKHVVLPAFNELVGQRDTCTTIQLRYLGGQS